MTAGPAASGRAAHGFWLDRVRGLAAAIAAAAERIEAERRLPEPLLSALVEAGLFRMLLPRRMGGAELDPEGFAAVIEAVAAIDASTAWCLCQACGSSMVAAFLAPEAAQEIFARDPRAILAWGPGPARAVAVAGGYRVTGRWSFASGGHHASWLGGHCPVCEADGAPRLDAEGEPVQRTMLFPAASAGMTDLWQVIGLRGTGSDSFAVTDLFVPEAHSVGRDDQAERREPGALYSFPTTSLFACGFAGVALGIARSTLDALVALARDKTPRGFRGTLRENAVIQLQVAQAEGRLRAAKLLLSTTLAQSFAAVARSGALGLEPRVEIRLASSHAIQEALAVVDLAYHAAGATAIFAGNGFERRFRDMHAVSQQVQGRLSHFETVGRFLLGLEPDMTFL